MFSYGTDKFYFFFLKSLVQIRYDNYLAITEGGCQFQLTGDVTLPEPQSYRENELIYSKQSVTLKILAPHLFNLVWGRFIEFLMAETRRKS